MKKRKKQRNRRKHRSHSTAVSNGITGAGEPTKETGYKPVRKPGKTSNRSTLNVSDFTKSKLDDFIRDEQRSTGTKHSADGIINILINRHAYHLEHIEKEHKRYVSLESKITALTDAIERLCKSD